MWPKHKQSGFTIVELLIVIVVIAILAAITIVAYNGIQQRARDSIRTDDLSTIKKVLMLYQTVNGGVQKTSTYGGSGPGGWNISSSASWLTFLEPDYGKMPKDPVNTGITAPNLGGLAYFYYCYPAGSGYLPATANVEIGYRSETGNQYVKQDFAVDQCL